MKRSLATFLFLIIIPSCSTTDDSTEHSFQVFEDNAITFAVTSGGPKFQEELFTYELVTELKEDEREDSLLNNPGLPQFDSQGSIYMPDYGDDRIAVFDGNGIYERSIGRRGNGPGEFQSIRYMEVLGDSLIIQDRSLNRITVYHLNGRLIDTFTSLSGRFQGYWFLPPSSHLYSFYSITSDEIQRLLQAGVVYLNSNYDTLAVIQTPLLYGGDRLVDTPRSQTDLEFAVPRNLAQPRALYHRQHGIVLYTGSEASLDLFHPNGNQYKRILVELPQRLFTREDKRLEKSRLDLQIAESTGAQREVAENRRKSVIFLKHWPPWFSIQIDDAGFFWLMFPEHTANTVEAERGYLFYILSPEGEYLGQTRRPYSIISVVSQGHLCVLKYEPETDKPQYIFYRIHSAVEGLEYP